MVARPGSMLLSFSCPAIISLHGLCTVWVVSVKQSLMNGIAAQCTVYHVWLPSLGMAEEVRPNKCANLTTSNTFSTLARCFFATRREVARHATDIVMEAEAPVFDIFVLSHV